VVYTTIVTIDDIKKKIAPVLERYGVEYAGVFGSVARGEDTPESDIDILIELEHPVSLLRFFELNDALEAVLGHRVDLVTKNSLNRHVKPLVLADVQTVYEVR
jgi:uncharacterized protein